MEMDFVIDEERQTDKNQARGNRRFDPALSHTNSPFAPMTNNNPDDRWAVCERNPATEGWQRTMGMGRTFGYDLEPQPEKMGDSLIDSPARSTPSILYFGRDLETAQQLNPQLLLGVYNRKILWRRNSILWSRRRKASLAALGWTGEGARP